MISGSFFHDQSNELNYRFNTGLQIHYKCEIKLRVWLTRNGPIPSERRNHAREMWLLGGQDRVRRLWWEDRQHRLVLRDVSPRYLLSGICQRETPWVHHQQRLSWRVYQRRSFHRRELRTNLVWWVFYWIQLWVASCKQRTSLLKKHLRVELKSL